MNTTRQNHNTTRFIARFKKETLGLIIFQHMIHRYLDIVFIVDAWGHMDVEERPSMVVFIATKFFPFLLSEGEIIVGESIFLNRSNLEEPSSEQKKQKQL